MSTILFDKIVFGPIHSRRLGISLGMNLLPTDGKLCSFNCIYCECGLNENHRTRSKLPTRAEVKEALINKLSSMQTEGIAPDVITFAGNGEPTMHPEFADIIDDTIETRNRFFPKAKIAVLSNSTMLHKEDVFLALNKIEDNILKLDSISDSRIGQLNVPNSPAFTFDRLLEQLWLEALKQIKPRQVMIYTIDRETPVKNLKKVTKDELEAIADRARQEGFDVTVSA